MEYMKTNSSLSNCSKQGLCHLALLYLRQGRHLYDQCHQNSETQTKTIKIEGCQSLRMWASTQFHLIPQWDHDYVINRHLTSEQLID